MTEFYAWCTETLRKHCEDTAKIFDRWFGLRTARILAGRLGLQDNVELIRRLMALAVALHDVGKAHPRYQRTVKHRGKCPYHDVECNSCKEKPRFVGHEVLSGLLVDRLIDRILFEADFPQKESDTLRQILSLGVTYHHEAMREPHEVKPWVRDDSLTALVAQLAKVICVSPTMNVSKMVQESFDELLRLQSLSLEYPMKSRARKLYCLVAGPLMICDSAVASRNRGSRELSRFVIEARRAFPSFASLQY